MSQQGITETVLATELSEALKKDEQSTQEGLDGSNGKFGVHVSAWIRGVATEIVFTTYKDDH